MLAELLIIIGALMVIVNLLTELAKKLGLVEKNLFVLILSEVLTFIAFFAYVDIKSVHIEWYLVIATIFVGLGVAYAAMFGYDKLKEAITQIKNKDFE